MGLVLWHIQQKQQKNDMQTTKTVIIIIVTIKNCGKLWTNGKNVSNLSTRNHSLAHSHPSFWHGTQTKRSQALKHSGKKGEKLAPRNIPATALQGKRLRWCWAHFLHHRTIGEFVMTLCRWYTGYSVVNVYEFRADPGTVTANMDCRVSLCRRRHPPRELILAIAAAHFPAPPIHQPQLMVHQHSL